MSRLPTARSTLAASCLVVMVLAVGAAPAGGAVRHPTSDEPSSYRIEPGDTLSGLATRFRTSVRELASLNRLSNPNRIVAGRSLRVPGGGSESAGTASLSVSGSVSQGLPGARHRVVAGETLGRIAGRYGIPQDDLARWNGLSNGVLYATTSLVLYDPGPSPTTSIVCPVPGATFFNDWAFPRPGGRVHMGNDLFAPRGTPFAAPVSGTVTTERGPIGGLQVWLTDADGNRWMGSHLDAFGATGWVGAGDIIGYIGDSGNAAGSRPHLHLEYHPAGRQAVNAYPVLRQAC